jgi:hypothetical protein
VREFEEPEEEGVKGWRKRKRNGGAEDQWIGATDHWRNFLESCLSIASGGVPLPHQISALVSQLRSSLKPDPNSDLNFGSEPFILY